MCKKSLMTVYKQKLDVKTSVQSIIIQYHDTILYLHVPKNVLRNEEIASDESKTMDCVEKAMVVLKKTEVAAWTTS